MPSWQKLALSLLCRRVKTGGVRLTDWEGTERTYGPGPDYVDVEVKDSAIVSALLRSPSLAVGEAHTRGDLVIAEDQLERFFRLLDYNRGQVSPLIRQLAQLRSTIPANVLERQRAYIGQHYDDPGDDYYDLILDKDHRLYSCALWSGAESETLEQAQRNKVEDTLRRLHLKPGQRLLDIGSGWGGLALAAAEKYGVHVLGVTLSKNQLEYSRRWAKERRLDHLVRFEPWNYQELRQRLGGGAECDRIVSVGMFEHVGQGQQDKYFGIVRDLLRPGGVSLLHTITKSNTEPLDPWVARHIFPGGHLPTPSSLFNGIKDAGMWTLGSQDWGRHYGPTLACWARRHREHRSTIEQLPDCGPEFYNKWLFWLVGSQVGFERGKLGLRRIVFGRSEAAFDDYPAELRQ